MLKVSNSMSLTRRASEKNVSHTLACHLPPIYSYFDASLQPVFVQDTDITLVWLIPFAAHQQKHTQSRRNKTTGFANNMSTSAKEAAAQLELLRNADVESRMNQKWLHQSQEEFEYNKCVYATRGCSESSRRSSNARKTTSSQRFQRSWSYPFQTKRGYI